MLRMAGTRSPVLGSSWLGEMKEIKRDGGLRRKCVGRGPASVAMHLGPQQLDWQFKCANSIWQIGIQTTTHWMIHHLNLGLTSRLASSTCYSAPLPVWEGITPTLASLIAAVGMTSGSSGSSSTSFTMHTPSFRGPIDLTTSGSP